MKIMTAKTIVRINSAITRMYQYLAMAFFFFSDISCSEKEKLNIFRVDNRKKFLPDQSGD